MTKEYDLIIPDDLENILLGDKHKDIEVLSEYTNSDGAEYNYFGEKIFVVKYVPNGKIFKISGSLSSWTDDGSLGEYDVEEISDFIPPTKAQYKVVNDDVNYAYQWDLDNY